MGNSHSSVESLSKQPLDPQDPAPNPKAVKKQHQKLSKPRVGNHTAATKRPTANDAPASSSSLLNPSRNNTPSRRSTLLSQAPLSPQPVASPTAPTDVHKRQQNGARAPAADSGEPPRRFSLFRSKSSQEDRRLRRKSGLLAPPLPGKNQSRSNSMNFESAVAVEHDKRRLGSWNTAGNGRPANTDCSSYEASPFLNGTETPLSPEPEPMMLDANTPDASPNAWKGSNPYIASAVPPTTLDPDVSLYAPVRRRSAILTPGLATRAPEDDVETRQSKATQNSPPGLILDGEAGQESLDLITERAMSPAHLPVISLPDEVDRIPTPSSVHYKQLGSMSFGSLRVINGAASPVPSVERDRQRDEEALQAAEAMDAEEQCLYPRFNAARVSEKTEKIDMAVARSRSTHDIQSIRSGKADLREDAACPVELTTWPSMPNLRTTSKNMAVEDELFDEEAQPELPTAEVLDAKSPDASSMSELNSIVDSGAVATPDSDGSCKSFSNADSGYGSNVSLRSTRSRLARDAESMSCADLDDPGEEVRPSPGEIVGDSKSATFPPPAEAKLVVDTSTFELLTGSRPSPTNGEVSPVSAGSELSRSSSAKRSYRKPQDSHRGDGIGLSDGLGIRNRGGLPASGSSGSALNSGNKPRTGRNAKSHVDLNHPAKSHAPSVPQHLEVNPDIHARQHPTTSKRFSLRSQKSRDTLKSIMRVESVEHIPTEARNQRSVHKDDLVDRPPTPKSQRRRSLHSAASLISRTSLRRKPVDAGDTRLQDDWIQNGFESHVTSIDSIRSSVGKSAFDSAFEALPDKVQRQPPRRSMTMDVGMEREMDFRRHSSLTRWGTTSSRTSPIPEMPDMSPAMFKSKTPPPISIQNRSAKSLRKRPFVRPRSTPDGLIPRKGNRENMNDGSVVDYPVPPVPPISPEYAQQYPEFQHLRAGPAPGRDDRPRDPNMRVQPMSKSGTGPRSYVQPGLGPRRPVSASAKQSRHHGGPYSQGFGDADHRRRTGPPPPRHHPESVNVAQDGGYYQNQLLQLQDEQRGGGNWEQSGRYPLMGKPALNQTPRDRSLGSLAQADKPQYRALHSYNSPAYQNEPVWG